MTDYSTLKPIVLFEKHGMDTLQIAKLKGVSEAEVYNSLHRTRQRRRIQDKYELKLSREELRAKRNADRRLIKYAGHSG